MTEDKNWDAAIMCNHRCICNTYRGPTDGASVCRHVTAMRQKLLLQTGMKTFRTSSLKTQQWAPYDGKVSPVLIRGQGTALQKQQAVAKEQATNRAGSGCSFAWRDEGPVSEAGSHKRSSSVRHQEVAASAGCQKAATAFVKGTVANLCGFLQPKMPFFFFLNI